MSPVLPSIRKRMSAPAGDLHRVPLEALLSSYFSPQISSSCSEVSVQHVQGTRVNETLTHEGMMTRSHVRASSRPSRTGANWPTSDAPFKEPCGDLGGA